MVTGAYGRSDSDGVLASVPPAVGAFRFWFVTQRWEWSPELYRMYGYQPGTVEPTTELMLSHKHPGDRESVARSIARSIEMGVPFSSRNRFLDTAGTEHEAIVIADRIVDDSGAPVGTAGYYIDLTETLAASQHETLAEVLPEVVAARAVIEQAKGVLMRMYTITAEQAFRVLAWRSQETNTKIRDLAAQLIDDLTRLPSAEESTVTSFDHLLLTAHTRIPKRPDHPPE